ncbi:MAG: nitrilase-related carbon-nitrogen hydrolase, partial [Shinella sp.]
MTVTIAAVQMCSGTDPVRNVETMRRLVREAAAKGAVYVQTPEMTGALQRDRTGLKAILRSEADDLVVAAATELARELGIHMHVGSTAIALSDGKIANRGFLFGPDGEKVCSYDKIHMFDV